MVVCVKEESANAYYREVGRRATVLMQMCPAKASAFELDHRSSAISGWEVKACSCPTSLAIPTSGWSFPATEGANLLLLHCPCP